MALEHPAATDHVQQKQASFHAEIVSEVAEALRENDVVVVGMTVNPHCKRARKALTDAGIEHAYLEYGGYHSMWKERLALKIWAGWPTFPMVFVKGALIGGANETQHLIKEGELQGMLGATA